MDRFEQLTAKYLDEVLSPVEGQELANHLRADPQAARQFLAIYSQDRLLVELHRSEDRPAVESIMAEIRGEENAFVGSVMQRVRDQGQRSGVEVLPDSLTWLRSLWRTGLAWAGAAAVLFIAFYFFVLRPVVGEPVLLAGKESSVTVERRGKNVPASDNSKLQPDDVLTLSGTNAVAITYAPENTRLDLQPGSTVKLLDWTRGKRLELRLGRVEASVARQRTFRPLLVRTLHAEARVLGTRFTLATTTNATRLDVSEGKVRLTRTSDGTRVDVAKDHYAIAATGVELAALPQTGSILREYWRNLPGRAVNDLLDHPDYPDRPNDRDYVDLLEVPAVGATDYGCRLVGYLHPPITGPYVFWIAASPAAAVNLSPDENPANAVRIFGESFDFGRGRESLPREWERTASSSRTRSQPITLVAGRRYYIEAVHKTDDRGGHLAIAWTPPGGEREVITGRYLSPLKPKPTGKKP